MPNHKHRFQEKTEDATRSTNPTAQVHSIAFFCNLPPPPVFQRYLEPQSHFGDKALKFQVVCPQNGTVVLKGLRRPSVNFAFAKH